MSYTLQFSGEEIDALLAYISAKIFSDARVDFSVSEAAEPLSSGDSLASALGKIAAWKSDYLSKKSGGFMSRYASIYSLGNGTLRFPNIEIGSGTSAGVPVERTDRKATTMPATPSAEQYPSLSLLKTLLDKKQDTLVAGYNVTLSRNADGTVTIHVPLWAENVGVLLQYGRERFQNVQEVLDVFANDLQELKNKADSAVTQSYVDAAIAAAIGNVDTLLGSGVIE